jgi:hypothetical protein
MDRNDDVRPSLEELSALVSGALAKDHDIDRAVRAALDRDPSPIQAIKALCASTGMGLAAAKPIVDRNLPLHQQEANERLRAAAREAMRGTSVASGTARSSSPTASRRGVVSGPT